MRFWKKIKTRALSHAVQKVLSLMRDQYEEKKVGLEAKVA
jgi:hypothetical protein